MSSKSSSAAVEIEMAGLDDHVDTRRDDVDVVALDGHAVLDRDHRHRRVAGQ
jgi:hypothetical protein